MLGLAALAGFLFAETRAAEPVLPLRIFRNRNFSLISVVGFLVGFTMFGAMTFLPLYQQTVQGASATNSGLLLLPMLLAMMVVSMVAGRVTTTTGKYKIFPIVGGALMTVGLFLLSQMDAHTSRTHVRPLHGRARRRYGLPDADHHAGRAEQRRDEGHGRRLLLRHPLPYASAAPSASRSSARCSHNRVQRRMAARAARAARRSPRAAPSSTRPPSRSCPPAVKDAYLHAVAVGTHPVFLWGAVVSVIGFVAALFVKEVPLRGAGPRCRRPWQRFRSPPDLPARGTDTYESP